MKHGKLKIIKTNYTSKEEVYQHAYYILSSSKELILSYTLKHHPKAHWAAKWALDSYTMNPDKRFWTMLGAFTLYLTKRASKKVNFKGHNPNVFEKRSWRTLLSMSLVP
jgi:hypothetical protein